MSHQSEGSERTPAPAEERFKDGQYRFQYGPLKAGETLAVKIEGQTNLRDRITHAEVEAEMRLAGIAHMNQVAWAILETQGKIGFIRKDGGQVNPTTMTLVLRNVIHAVTMVETHVG